MFAEKLSILMNLLQVNNTELALKCGFDRTNISRFRKGSKKPSASSDICNKLIKGLYFTAKESPYWTDFLQIIEGNDCSTEEEIFHAILQFLQLSPNKEALQESIENSYFITDGFSERLDQCMNIIGLTNIRLSKLLNVDASLISRYRSGQRKPQIGANFTKKMAEILYHRVMILNKCDEISDLLGGEEESLTEEHFTQWLFHQKNQEIDLNSVESIIDILSTYTSPDYQQVENMHQLVETILQESHESGDGIYVGTEGLKSMVLHFLKQALISDAKELWLYSDQSMDWITQNKSYQIRWAAMLMACLQKKIQIHIIHNVDRDSEEMNHAILNWLPLYMSGNIKSYYWSNENRGLFSHTFFLCPGVACIEGFHVTGTENEAIYHYYDDKGLLNRSEKAYKKLFSNTKPLIHVQQNVVKDEEFGEITILHNKVKKYNKEDEIIEIYTLQKPSFTNVKIMIDSDSCKVSRLIEPQLTFYFTHPMMIQAFRKFAEEWLIPNSSR